MSGVVSSWSVGTGRVAADNIPVLIRTRPEFREERFHSREVSIDVARRSVEFVAFRILVRVVVANQRQIFKGAQVQSVLPARRIAVGVRHLLEHHVLHEAGFNVRVLEIEVMGHPWLLVIDPTP